VIRGRSGITSSPRSKSSVMSPHMRSGMVWSLLIIVVASACERSVGGYPVPSGARTASNGMKYVVVRAGTGAAAGDGGIWGVKWTLLSHEKPGCEYPCTVQGLHSSSDSRFGPWRNVLSTMREGEVRRVWVTWPGEEHLKTYDVELSSVVRTDSAGNPVYENPYPNLGKPLPHKAERRAP